MAAGVIKNVLSIDGGGIRGIIPAMVLAEIERRCGQPACRLFDLIAGTSTGGLLALGLAKPGDHGMPAYPADQLVALYEREGGHIFSRSLWHHVVALGNLVEEKYPSQGVDAVLAKYFGDTRLSEALTKVLVTGYEIERRDAFFFKSHRAANDGAYDFKMRLIARATSAAPTYFEAARIQAERSSDYYAFVDGGVFANNPAMCAYVEAKDIWGEDSDVLVVSLGTGTFTHPILYREARNWGEVQWAEPILDVVFDGVSDTVDHQLDQLCNKQQEVPRYFRFQVKLCEGNAALDDASAANVRALRLLAEELIGERDEELDDLCKKLATARV